MAIFNSFLYVYQRVATSGILQTVAEIRPVEPSVSKAVGRSQVPGEKECPCKVTCVQGW